MSPPPPPPPLWDDLQTQQQLISELDSLSSKFPSCCQGSAAFSPSLYCHPVVQHTHIGVLCAQQHLTAGSSCLSEMPEVCVRACVFLIENNLEKESERNRTEQSLSFCLGSNKLKISMCFFYQSRDLPTCRKTISDFFSWAACGCNRGGRTKRCPKIKKKNKITMSCLGNFEGKYQNYLALSKHPVLFWCVIESCQVQHRLFKCALGGILFQL